MRAAKNRPVQARALATRESLLAATAALLDEVGIERLSSNLICARAGVTPPAFYRYFEDKYAPLAELGERLMDAQNQVIGPLLARDDLDVTEAELRMLLLESIAVTDNFPAGPRLLHALRAAQPLQHIRIDSHRRMSKLIAKAVIRRNKRLNAQAAMQARLLIDMGYAAIELAFDEPKLKREAIAENAAAALAQLVALMRRTA